jgi:hypothetical protein
VAGCPKVSDQEIARAYNDVARLPRIADVAAEVKLQIRHLQSRLQKIRQVAPAGTLIDRQAAYYGNHRKLVAPGTESDPRVGGRYLVPLQPKRWLLTSAQDETAVHAPFWTNLLAYGDAIGAEVLVGGFTYNKSLFEDHASRTAVFPEAVRPYLIHDDRMLGGEAGLMFAAKMNILPTAVRPLSGLDNYSRGRWAVFPHAKVQLISVPALPGRHPAMVMTSGTCTVENYIEKKAGLKAAFHHIIGATIVEQDSEGRLFCRQISASDDGSFQDLDARVDAGRVSFGHRVEEISWGDVHMEQIDPQVAMTCWGYDVERDRVTSESSMIHALRPRHQAFHDLLDFQARNHHRRGDHSHAFKMTVGGSERVDDGIAKCARFLAATAFDWTTSAVVASNHSDALQRWLRETDPRSDPVNLPAWCELNLEIYRRIEAGDAHFDIFPWALRRHDPLGDIVFVPRNGSYLVCQQHGGIECGLHGDEGPNGARGSAMNLNRVAVRINIGHSHSAMIVDGVYQAGLCGTMDQGYNSGPSSWSHSQIVTYPSSKRTLITIIDGKWRA